MLNPYHEHIDKMIIEILYKNEKLSTGELKNQLDQSLENHGYKKTSPDTYWKRLKQLTESSYNNKQSKYVIQPVLNRYEERRGGKVFYSLTKNAKIRNDLKIPIMKSEIILEKAYRLLLHYMAFEEPPHIENHSTKLKDENEYDIFLQKVRISKNELQLFEEPSFNRNLNKNTIWIHPHSGIKLIRVDYLEDSDRHGNYEYYYKLPGISPNEFKSGKRLGFVYEHLNFTDDEVNKCFKLLEKKEIIKKLKLLSLIQLNEERYDIVDNFLTIADNNNMLKNFLQDSWVVQGSATLYYQFLWKHIRAPTDEEKIWYEQLWGKTRTNQWFLNYNKYRREYKKSKNQMSKEEIQKKLEVDRSLMRNKFESIKNKYPDIIKEYSYLVDPLLNMFYPQFLRD